MLQFYLGKIEPLLEFPKSLFPSYMKEEWLNCDFGREAVRYVDKSEVITGRLIESPRLGAISPNELSGSLKSALMAVFCDRFRDYWYDGSKMGDNCYPVLVKGALEFGVTIKVQVGRLLRESWDEEDPILPMNQTVYGYKDCLLFLAAHTELFDRG